MTILSKDVLKYKKKIVFNAGVEATLEYSNPKKNVSPTIQLLFSPFGLPFVPIEIIGTDVNQIVSSLSWTKDRTNPGGVLSVELVPDASTIQRIVDTINKYSGNLYSKIWGELGVDLEDLFKPMTLCQLWIEGYHVMTGTVRSCHRSASVTNTGKSVSYSLILDELGNMYNMNTMSIDTVRQDGMNLNLTDSLKKAFQMIAEVKGIPLNIGIKLVLDAFSLMNLTEGVSVSDGFPLSSRLLATSWPNGGLAQLSIASYMTTDQNIFKMHSSGGGQQSVWGFLKNNVPNPWMEFYTESGGRTIVTDSILPPSILFPGLNYVVARTVPYSNPLLGTVNPYWLTETTLYELNALSMVAGGDFIIITDDMIHNKTLGFDCINQSTVFHARYTCKGATQAPDLVDRGIKSAGPLNPFASGGIPTFGIREMFQTIDSTNLEGLGLVASIGSRIVKNFRSGSGIISKNALSNLLAVWFRNQSRFREGTITLKGIPYARPGMFCLYLPTLDGKKTENLRDIGIYYIDSLNHEYSLTNTDISYTTTLNVIRGTPLPTSVAQTALLLFDFEILPPQVGLVDGEYTVLKALRAAASRGVVAPG
jgi:hypothetical protein